MNLILSIHAVFANWTVDESCPEDITGRPSNNDTLYSLFLTVFLIETLRTQPNHSSLTHYAYVSDVITGRGVNNDITIRHWSD